MRRAVPGSRRRGLTLVELILTLGLSVMLMSMIGTAFTFYATKLDTRDTELRRVQLAQSILDMISDDLRAALHPPEFDDSALAALLASSAGGGSGSVPGAGEDLSAAGLDDMSGAGLDASASESVETVDLSSGTATTRRPGLLGNQTQIQFDVSRLPRIEEYQPMLADNAMAEMVDIPSDIKKVTYYLQPPGGGVTDPFDSLVGDGAAGSSSTASSAGGGLVRRSLDRAITKWSLENGAITSLLSTGDLLATEVVGLEFRYWDGMQWQIYWDSDEMGALPQAIQVNLTMLESAPTTEAPAGLDAEPVTRVYEHVIRLPMGRPTEFHNDLSSMGL